MKEKQMNIVAHFEQEIHNLLIERKQTLVLAESATGGALAVRFTRMPGASAYFLGSIVAYSNELKMKCLQVKESSLRGHGAVSSEVVLQMARAAKQLTASSYAVAISGIAGPGGATTTKPVGLMWAAIIDDDNDPLVWSFEVNGSRIMIIEQTVEIVLQKLLSVIQR